MEYIFGIISRNGLMVENLKIVGKEHTNFDGFKQVIREYPDRIIVDNFRILEKYLEKEDTAGNTYDWYIIDNHNQYVDKFTPVEDSFRIAQNASSIVFVTLSESGAIDEVTAGEYPELFAEWESGISYVAGNIRRYGDLLYRCLQPHTSMEGWEPDKAVSLWVRIADPAEEWPEWSQPIGAHDAYNAGDKVSHNGKKWTSDVDSNVWEPGVYGWSEVVSE